MSEQPTRKRRGPSPAELARPLTEALRQEVAFGVNWCRTLEEVEPATRAELWRVIRAARSRRQGVALQEADQDIFPPDPAVLMRQDRDGLAKER